MTEQVYPYPRRLDDLFDVVRMYTVCAGGDGDGWVISTNYREYAKWFEIWEAEQWRAEFTTRDESSEGVIWFSHEQEAICFADQRGRLPAWKPDILIEVD